MYALLDKNRRKFYAAFFFYSRVISIARSYALSLYRDGNIGLAHSIVISLHLLQTNYCNNDRSKIQGFCCTTYNLELLLKLDRFLAMYVITFP